MDEKTVLIVEDNNLNMKLVKDLLAIDSINSISADRAETGIELARLHTPDLILMDIELPGMNGFTAMRNIKADPHLEDIPVLALTAYAMEDDKIQAKEAGCDGYITKPIKINLFRETVKSFLGKTEDLPGNDEKESFAPVVRKYKPGKKILVVDDDELNVKLLSALLSSKGYEIITALNGKDAVELVNKNHPDLILLDIMMPEMDGYEVTMQLKSDSLTEGIPIILVTALTGEGDKKKGLEAGADEFINKPIDTPELEARIISLLNLKEYREQLGSRKKSEELVIKNIPGQMMAGGKQDTLPTVLIVDDDPMTVKLMTNYLSDIKCCVETACSGEEAIEVVEEKKVDVMLLDVMLPSMNGYDVCRRIKKYEKTYPIQVVMFTGLTDTSSKLKGIEAGTDDFLLKPVDRDELKARLLALFKKKAYLDQLMERVDSALYAAITDKLTGAYNHGYFKHFLDMEFNRAKRHDNNMSLLMIDLDDFKKFNDRYGHPCGDKALQIIAAILRENIRNVDFLARYGGEEFAVILPYMEQKAAQKTAERLLRKINNHSELPFAPGMRLSVSIGVSVFPDQADTSEELLKAADNALYTAKKKGKNCFTVYSEFAKPVYTENTCEVRWA